MPMYHHKFSVSGPAPFPVDMLRYDGCYPSTQDDTARLARAFRSPFSDMTIHLSTINDQRRWSPTVARWNSFGWFVNAIVFSDKL